MITQEDMLRIIRRLEELDRMLADIEKMTLVLDKWVTTSQVLPFKLKPVK
jgi:hypothetical protein